MVPCLPFLSQVRLASSSSPEDVGFFLLVFPPAGYRRFAHPLSFCDPTDRTHPALLTTPLSFIGRCLLTSFPFLLTQPLLEQILAVSTGPPPSSLEAGALLALFSLVILFRLLNPWCGCGPCDSDTETFQLLSVIAAKLVAFLFFVILLGAPIADKWICTPSPPSVLFPRFQPPSFEFRVTPSEPRFPFLFNSFDRFSSGFLVCCLILFFNPTQQKGEVWNSPLLILQSNPPLSPTLHFLPPWLS